MKRCVLDARHDSRAKVFAALAHDLGFPPHAAGNLDALWDVLRTDIAGPIEIVWRDSARARAALGTDFEAIVGVLREAAAARRDVTLRID